MTKSLLILYVSSVSIHLSIPDYLAEFKPKSILKNPLVTAAYSSDDDSDDGTPSKESANPAASSAITLTATSALPAG